MYSEGPMTVVLVHGAWHSPSHWNSLIPQLSMPTVAVDLPSSGSGRADADMHADAAAIRRVLDEHKQVTLVAHSYGGIPATEAAADHPAVRSLLYVAAFNADLGETLGGFEPADPAVPNVHPATDCEPAPGGLVAFRRDRAIGVFYHDCPDPDEAIRHLRPMAPAVIGQAPSAVAWKEIPSAYVICTRDRASAVSTQRRLAARAQRVFEVGTGHSPFLASPGQLARIITEVATRATATV